MGRKVTRVTSELKETVERKESKVTTVCDPLMLFNFGFSRANCRSDFLFVLFAGEKGAKGETGEKGERGGKGDRGEK